MDLLALSGGSVLVAATRKAVRTWVARRQFRVCIDGPFADFLGNVGSGSRIGQCHCQGDARIYVAVEGWQGGALGGRGGVVKVCRLIVQLGSRR